MVPQVHVTRQPSGSIGRMLKGPVGIRQMEKGPSGDFYDELQASRMSNYRSHRYMSDGEGSHRKEKGSSGDFYDELQASQMSNCRSHRYTSDGESTVWRSMTKSFNTYRILFVIDV